LGTRIAQHEVVVLRGQQGVDRDGHHTGQDASQKRNRPMQTVVHAQQHALFLHKTLILQALCKAMGLLRELRIAQCGACQSIDVSQFVLA
jgi:hypothetical protein